jgi:DNA-binding MarR family transcriptional regulator
MIADIQRATHLIGLHLERAGLGVTQAEAHLLARLADGPATVGELHREFGHKRSTLTSVLDRLEERGYVERTVNPDDRRSFVVTTTREGGRVARRVRRAFDELERTIRGAADIAAVAERLLFDLE